MNDDQECNAILLLLNTGGLYIEVILMAGLTLGTKYISQLFQLKDFLKKRSQIFKILQLSCNSNSFTIWVNQTNQVIFCLHINTLNRRLTDNFLFV